MLKGVRSLGDIIGNPKLIEIKKQNEVIWRNELNHSSTNSSITLSGYGLMNSGFIYVVIRDSLQLTDD